jgi:hypothetical protein
MRASLIATTTVAALSAVALSGAQGSAASAHDGSASALLARARHVKAPPKPSTKTRRRSKPTRCLSHSPKPKRAAHRSKRRGVRKTKPAKCRAVHRPRKKPKRSPGLSGPTGATISSGPTTATGSTGSTGSGGADKPAQTNCFANPEACGYPGPHNTGPDSEGEAKCSSYPEGGAPTIETGGEIREKRFTGVTIKASNVTLNDVCIVGTSSNFTLLNFYEGSNFTIENSVIRGTSANPGTEASIWDSHNETPLPIAANDLMTNCDECIHGAWNVQNSYAISNGENGGHTEDWFVYVAAVAEHDTLLNPNKQTAVIFPETGTSLKVSNSLLGGGGYTLHGGAGTTFEVKDDRFARKVCTKAIISDVEGRGGHECSGEPSEKVNWYDSGEGSGGYFPYGGFFGLTDGSFSKWEGNYWDDNLEACVLGTASCP